MPTTPTLLYDGDCGFCLHWIQKWERVTAGKVKYLPYQKSLKQFPQVTVNQCRQAVQLIMPDGKVISGAHAVFHALALAPYSKRGRRLLWLYECVPPLAWIAEAIYQWVSYHRISLSKNLAKQCKV